MVVGIVIIFCIVVLALAVFKRRNANNALVKEKSILPSAAGEGTEKREDGKENFTDNDELAAVITAAVISSMRASGIIHPKIRVKSFRRTSQTMPVWNSVWRNEQILGKH